MQIKFIDEIRSAWKLFSVWIPSLLGFMALLSPHVDVLKALFPSTWGPYIVAAFAFATVLGRLIKQPATVIEGNEQKLVAMSNKINALSATFRTLTATADPKAVTTLDTLTQLKQEYDRLLKATIVKSETEDIPLKKFV